ncbi:hypothetical protein FM107_01185 [Sphingobacterium sp. JB170]|nr:hypothetical protein FM107_01185 [Sphingobacterium sp. JB170]
MFSSKKIRFNYGNTEEKEYGIICQGHSQADAQDVYSRAEDFDRDGGA